VSGVNHQSSIRNQKSRAFTLVELLVVIVIIGILIALLLPAVQAAREAARCTQCQNHLKQIALAVRGFEIANGHFPSGGWGCHWTGDPDHGNGKEQPGGWFYSILPHLDLDALYRLGSDGNRHVTSPAVTPQKEAGTRIRLQTPLDVVNCPSRRQPILYPNEWYMVRANTLPVVLDQFQCPTLPRSDYAACCGDTASNEQGSGPSDVSPSASTVYNVAISWTNNHAWPIYDTLYTGISYFRSQIMACDVSDGLSSTYMVGEKYANPDYYFSGLSTSDNESPYHGFDNDLYRNAVYTPQEDTPGVGYGGSFGSAHAHGVHMAFCDGSVQAISYSIDLTTHRRLANRKDGCALSAKKIGL
jgi:prepilin-type N-terminal cleavage/methylation domain-containing protein/prepilin-type processing-associated H-X9-DG protein